VPVARRPLYTAPRMAGMGADQVTLSAAYRAVGVTFRTLVRRSKAMSRVLDDAEGVARSGVSVLLLGETGTGKNLIAQAIHNGSPRAAGPFVALNCSALPDSLLEAELFGAEEGAYTDSRRTRRGRFELAHQGTLFLDEIGDLSPAAQAKILHALEYREYTRVGGEQTLSADVRFIAATNVPLESRVESGAFRRDLFYRLNEAVLHLPPLRERPDDIPELVERFIEEAAAKGGQIVRKADKTVLKLLAQHAWPGNVRELRSIVKRGVARAAGDTLTVEDLGMALQLVEVWDKAASAGAPGTAAGAADLTLAAAEKRHVSRVLQMTGWVKAEAARMLDISRPTLDRKIAEYGLAKDGE
jgi:two-component system response regulator HydG